LRDGSLFSDALPIWEGVPAQGEMPSGPLSAWPRAGLRPCARVQLSLAISTVRPPKY
jgi:hypothetical protein